MPMTAYTFSQLMNLMWGEEEAQYKGENGSDTEGRSAGDGG